MWRMGALKPDCSGWNTVFLLITKSDAQICSTPNRSSLAQRTVFSRRWKRVPASCIKHGAGFLSSIIHFLFSLHLLSVSSLRTALPVYLLKFFKTNMASSADAHRVPMLAHIALWKNKWNAPDLTVISRDATGKPEGKYPKGEPNHLVSASIICRGMLKEHKVREGFITFAVRIGLSQPNAWYKQVRPPKTTAEVVDSFIDSILAEFPSVFMDYALKNPDNKGFHNRRRWDKYFKPANQPISVNANVCETYRVEHDKSCSSKLTIH